MRPVSSIVRGLLALVLPAAAHGAPAGTGVAALADALRDQPELRARFAQDPHATLRGFGIDPTPFPLHGALTEAEIDALLARWDAVRTPPPTQPVEYAQASAPQPPVAVYGPPPVRVRPSQQGTPTPPPPPGPSGPPSPPVPAYGPPPLPSRR